MDGRIGVTILGCPRTNSHSSGPAWRAVRRCSRPGSPSSAFDRHCAAVAGRRRCRGWLYCTTARSRSNSCVAARWPVSALVPTGAPRRPPLERTHPYRARRCRDLGPSRRRTCHGLRCCATPFGLRRPAGGSGRRPTPSRQSLAARGDRGRRSRHPLVGRIAAASSRSPGWSAGTGLERHAQAPSAEVRMTLLQPLPASGAAVEVSVPPPTLDK